MRLVSLCTVLGAVLLPAVSAVPLRRPCNPNSAATTSAPLAAETTTSSISTLTSTSTETATATATVSVTQTTLITSIRTDTTGPTTTTDSTTATDVLTTSTATPTVETLNGDFESADRSMWGTRTVTFKNDPDNAYSGSWYAQYVVTDAQALGGNYINQTLNGLDTSRLFRLSFEGKLFEGAILNGATCQMEALFGPEILASWPIDPNSAGKYVSYTQDLSVPYKNTALSLRLRCSEGTKVTLTFGVDDVVFEALPQSAATQTTTLAPAVSTSAAPAP